MSFAGLGAQWHAASEEMPVSGVWTREITRVRVHVTPEGIRLEDDESLRHEAAKVALPLACLVIAIALLVAAIGRAQADQPALGWVLAALGFLFLVPVLAVVIVRLLEPIALVGCVLCAVALLPFPAGRRTLARWWHRIRAADGLTTHRSDVVCVTVGRSWRPRVDIACRERAGMHLYVRDRDLPVLTGQLGRYGYPIR